MTNLADAMTDITTLEGAIEWMDRASRWTREVIAAVGVFKRDNVAMNAAGFLAFQAALVGARVEINFDRKRDRIIWHGVEVKILSNGLAVFDLWLAHARAKAAQQ
jgi:hypothetical protein